MSFDYIIKDFITGKAVRNVGPQIAKQDVEQFLVNEKGFSKNDIQVDVPHCCTV